MKLLRMLSSLERWDGHRDVHRKNPTICGDAIADLRTSNNCLSTWCSNDENEKDIAIVALALGSDKAEKLCFVLLDENELHNIEIEISDKCKGRAGGLNEELLNNHRDLIELDYNHIGKLANYISPMVREGHFEVVTKLQIKELLTSFKERNLIDVTKVNDNLKHDLSW